MVDDAGPLGLDAVNCRSDERRSCRTRESLLLATLASGLGVEGVVKRMVCLDRSRPARITRGAR
jgi:hypothetical protein